MNSKNFKRFNIEEELNKVQMRGILGGYDGYEGEMKKCQDSKCNFTKQFPDGHWETKEGYCKVQVTDHGPYGYSTFKCYCSTEFSGPDTPVGSNGGETRCLA